MKKLAAIVVVALLGSLSVNATVVFNDTFDSGPSGFTFADINYNLPVRQAAGTTASSYTVSGTANAAASLYYDTFGYENLTSAAGGDHVMLDLDADFGANLVGKQWSLSYRELNVDQAQVGNWGGWCGVFIGSTRGFGTEFGVIFRPDGAYSIFNGCTEIGTGAAGDLIGEGTTYDMVITFDEVANTVSLSQQIHDDSLPAVDMGTYPMNFSGSSRFIQYRTHFDGGTSGLLETLQDDVTIEVVSSIPPPEIGDITVELLPGATGLALTWATDTGLDYATQIKSSLLDESWTNDITGIVGTGGDVTVTTAVDQAQSFYRVILDEYIQTPDGKEYLVFELTNVPLYDFNRAVGELVTDLGANNPASDRMYAFGMNRVPLLTRSVAALTGYVNSVFDIAEAHGVPAYFHIDPMYGFDMDNIPAGQGPSLRYWDHPDMCEWVNFPTGGQTNGQIPRVWINWGDWIRIGDALPNFESPALQQFYKSQLEDGILEPIKQRLLALQQEGKGYLFAGLNIGWETHLQDRSDQAGETIVAANTGETMSAWEQAKTGYAALYTKGWDDASLTVEANVRGISKDRLFYDLCAESVHSNMMLLAKTASDYGFYKSQIFSHIVALESYFGADYIENNLNNTLEIPPVWAALNDYCTPGFTLDEHGGAKYDLTEMENTFDAYGYPFKYAPIESYLINYPTEAEYSAQLTEFFTDADLVAVYGAVTNLTGNVSGYTMNNDQAAAIIDWLNP